MAMVRESDRKNSQLRGLVTSEWLAQHLYDPTVRVVEVDVNPANYDEWHIDGAVLWNVYADLKDAEYRPITDAAGRPIVAKRQRRGQSGVLAGWRGRRIEFPRRWLASEAAWPACSVHWSSRDQTERTNDPNHATSTSIQSPGMDEPPELQHNGHWRMAVWALRAGYVGLAVIMTGLIVMSSGSTPWVLAIGVIFWLAVAATTLTGFFWARSQLPEPRPGLWSMRFMLIHDTVRSRSSAHRS